MVAEIEVRVDQGLRTLRDVRTTTPHHIAFELLDEDQVDVQQTAELVGEEVQLRDAGERVLAQSALRDPQCELLELLRVVVSFAFSDPL